MFSLLALAYLKALRNVLFCWDDSWVLHFNNFKSDSNFSGVHSLKIERCLICFKQIQLKENWSKRNPFDIIENCTCIFMSITLKLHVSWEVSLQSLCEISKLEYCYTFRFEIEIHHFFANIKHRFSLDSIEMNSQEIKCFDFHTNDIHFHSFIRHIPIVRFIFYHHFRFVFPLFWFLFDLVDIIVR